MIYSTPEFFILFLVTSALLLLAGSRIPVRFAILTAASLFFYAWAGLFDTVIFFFVVLISWLCALGMTRSRHKKAYLVIGVTVMSVHLFFWKYASWLSADVQKVWPDFLDGRHISLPLPIGISFFTLQGIAYLIDLNRGEAQFLKFREYFLFKIFFPQLVAGPIVRFHQLAPQIKRIPIPSMDDVSAGISLFCLGLFKKMVIADRAALFVDLVFENPGQYGRKALVLALLGYTAQIWGDFSGYTDMGRGAARILGFRLPENFLAPYLSRSPSEFWRRWHITLSEWIRDYIYIPLGGSEGSFARILAVALLTMVISGLWHGANWTFLLWGLYHGFLLAGERVLRKIRPEKTAPVCLSVPFMFALTVLGWLIFRAENLTSLEIYLEGLFGPRRPQLAELTYQANAIGAVILCFLIQGIFYWDLKKKCHPILDYIGARLQALEPSLSRMVLSRYAISAAIGVALSCVLMGSLVLRSQASKAFIYFQF
jgi:alginate O-acetyltransferase complex protein AlgI